MFSTGDPLSDQSLPEVNTRRALVVLDMQNDLFTVDNGFYITKNRDVLQRVKEIIPHFRRLGDIIWVQTEAAALPGPQFDDPMEVESSVDITAEKNREERIKEESQLVDDVSGNDNTFAPSPSGPNMIYAPSQSKGLMKQLSADDRAKKRDAETSFHEDDDPAWPERFPKPRKGQQSNFCVAGTKGAAICDELVELVDESRDLVLIKHSYSAFDQTTLLMSLRMNLVTEVYLCGCLTNTAVYTSAADAVQHGLQVTIVEDCLGYRNEAKHDEAVRQMADVMGVNGTDSHEIIAENVGMKAPNPDTIWITLNELSIIHKPVPTDGAIKQLEEIINSPSAGGDAKAAEQGGKHDTRRRTRGKIKLDEMDENKPMGSGDSQLIVDAIGHESGEGLFDLVKDEVGWQKMYHRSGEVPRLVAVQGDVGEDGEVPVYRHPADESPPLRPFTAHVQRIRREVEQVLSQPFNHVLIQLYRGGNDNISEHSDKTLDLVRESRVINVSLGAQRLMTLRTKKSVDKPSARQTQRIRMPNNSIFVLGPQTNREWLHGIRADKRPFQEKSEEELAYSGGRISLTFRQIGTFYNSRERLIWGSGARSKSKQTAHHISSDQGQVERMLQAFGTENRETNFDWDAEYGAGYDVMDLISREPELTLSGDPVANIRVRLALSYKSVKCKILDRVATKVPPERQSWTHGLANLQNPVFTDVNGESIEGDLTILFHLEKRSDLSDAGGVNTTTQLFRCAAQSNELLYLWREYLENPSSPPTHRFKLEKAPGPHGSLLEEVEIAIQSWEIYLATNTLQYVTGDVWTMLDCAFWPVLDRIISQWVDFPTSRYPCLVGYHRRGLEQRETAQSIVI